MIEKLCSFCGSNIRVVYSSLYKDYLCNRHYMQMYHTGKLKERFMKDLNEIIIKNKFAEIILYDINHEEKARCEIDIKNVGKCKNIKWSLHNEGYVCTKIKRETIFIHNYIMNNNSREIVVDHKDGNKLNNKEINLRKATYSQNNMNSKIRNNNSSGVTGVSFAKLRNEWEAYLRKDGKRVFHRYFKNYEDAITARKQAEIEFFGEFRYE